MILGAGLHGAALAYYLTRRGVKPLIVEREKVAAAASGKGGHPAANVQQTACESGRETSWFGNPVPFAMGIITRFLAWERALVKTAQEDFWQEIGETASPESSTPSLSCTQVTT